MDSIQGYGVPKVQLTHPRTAPGHHLLPSSEHWPALTLFPQTRKLTLDKIPAHRREEGGSLPAKPWIFDFFWQCWRVLDSLCIKTVITGLRGHVSLFMTDMWQEYSQSLRSPPPPLTWHGQSHIWRIMPPSLSLPDASATVPLTHYQPVTKTVAWHHSCVTKYCYQRPGGDCSLVQKGVFVTAAAELRYNRHCPEISTQHVTSSPLQINTYFLCESSLLSAQDKVFWF